MADEATTTDTNGQKMPAPPRAVAKVKPAKKDAAKVEAKGSRKPKKKRAGKKRAYRRKTDNFETQLKLVLKLYRQMKATGKAIAF